MELTRFSQACLPLESVLDSRRSSSTTRTRSSTAKSSVPLPSNSLPDRRRVSSPNVQSPLSVAFCSFWKFEFFLFRYRQRVADRAAPRAFRRWRASSGSPSARIRCKTKGGAFRPLSLSDRLRPMVTMVRRKILEVESEREIGSLRPRTVTVKSWFSSTLSGLFPPSRGWCLVLARHELPQC